MGDTTLRVRRRTAAAALAVVAVAAGLVGGGAALAGAGAILTFSDVPEEHPFYDEVQWLADSGISAGYPDGSFRPGEPVTRQAMAAFLARATTYQVVTGEGTSTEGFVVAEATCPAGTVAVSGGYDTENELIVRVDGPIDAEMGGWAVIAERANPGSDEIKIVTTAICAPGTASAADEG